jgi:hypothetical protein
MAQEEALQIGRHRRHPSQRPALAGELRLQRSRSWVIVRPSSSKIQPRARLSRESRCGPRLRSKGTPAWWANSAPRHGAITTKAKQKNLQILLRQISKYNHHESSQSRHYFAQRLYLVGRY